MHRNFKRINYEWKTWRIVSSITLYNKIAAHYIIYLSQTTKTSTKTRTIYLKTSSRFVRNTKARKRQHHSSEKEDSFNEQNDLLNIIW